MKVVKHGTEAVFHKNYNNMLVKCVPVFFCGAKKYSRFPPKREKAEEVTQKKHCLMTHQRSVTGLLQPHQFDCLSEILGHTFLCHLLHCHAVMSLHQCLHIEPTKARALRRTISTCTDCTNTQWRTNTERKYKRGCYIKKNTCMNGFGFVAIDVFLFDENALQGCKKVINLCALFTRWQATIIGFFRL